MVWIGLVVLRQFRAARRPASRPTSRCAASCTRPWCRSVAWWFRHASTVAVASGALLLVPVRLPAARARLRHRRLRAAGARAAALGRRARRARHVDVRAHVHLAQHAGGAGLAARRCRRQGTRRAPASILFAGSISSCRARHARHGGGGPPLLTWPTARLEPPASDAVAAIRARSASPTATLPPCWRPPPRAPHLLALAAFASELARVPSAVTREPAMGEIRLQWWRDALEAPAPARAPAIPSPMPCAHAVLGATTCPARSCST